VFFPYKQPKLDPEEIRANILYTGLCHSDVLHSRALWNPNPIYPSTPGHEIIGEVSEVGENVKNFKKGDKVGFGTMRGCCEKCKFCVLDREVLCLKQPNTKKNELFTYGYQFGGYSTQLQQPASHFFKLSDKIELDKAAPLLCAGVTVYNPIKLYCKPGFKTAVIGIGGLGHLAVMMLSKLGHEVDAITSSNEKDEFIKGLGATGILNYKNKDELAKGKGQYDFIINTSPSSDGFDDFVSLTAKGGYFCQVGAPPVEQYAQFKLGKLVGPEIHLVGSNVGSRKVVQEMLDFCAENKIYPLVETFDFEDFEKALDRLENGRPIFRCVVKVSDYAKKNGLFK